MERRCQSTQCRRSNALRDRLRPERITKMMSWRRGAGDLRSWDARGTVSATDRVMRLGAPRRAVRRELEFEREPIASY
jgi:hypothetical protein